MSPGGQREISGDTIHHISFSVLWHMQSVETFTVSSEFNRNSKLVSCAANHTRSVYFTLLYDSREEKNVAIGLVLAVDINATLT